MLSWYLNLMTWGIELFMMWRILGLLVRRSLVFLLCIVMGLDWW